MQSNKIINVHTHLRKNDDVDARVKLWRKNNCVKVCCQVCATGQPGEKYQSNEEVAKWIKKYPDIIVGFGFMGLNLEVPAPDIVDKLKEQGFAGLKFICPSYNYDDERYFHIYERAESLNMPTLFHTGFLTIHDYDKKFRISQDKMRVVRMDALGRYFPKLRIMVAHLGNPEFNVALDIVNSFKNIYGEFSGASGSKFRETCLRKVFAPLPGARMDDPEENLALIYFKKLCFATDNPEPPGWIELSKRLMDELQIPEETRELFWWKNAAKWLGLEETSI